MSQPRICVPFEQYLNAYMTRINVSFPVIAGRVSIVWLIVCLGFIQHLVQR